MGFPLNAGNLAAIFSRRSKHFNVVESKKGSSTAEAKGNTDSNISEGALDETARRQEYE